MKKTNNAFSFVIVPPGSKKAISFRIANWIVYSVLSVSAVFIIFIGTSVYFTSDFGIKTLALNSLKQKTIKQEERVSSLNAKMEALKNAVIVVLEKEDEINRVLGNTKTKHYRKKKRGKTRTQKTIDRLNLVIQSTEKTQEEKLTFLENQLISIDKKISRIYSKVLQYKDQFASTPSIWPLYGRILSRYGPRIHPITRRRIFHKGIDIPSWYGAPIKATADGIVKYAGWSGTFGFVVIIDHKFGYRTVYAHASQLLVRKRQRIKKGQVIAQVGSTGFSTGAHLHYEIRRWRQAVNPNPYLDLDIFTASTRMW